MFEEWGKNIIKSVTTLLAKGFENMKEKLNFKKFQKKCAVQMLGRVN